MTILATNSYNSFFKTVWTQTFRYGSFSLTVEPICSGIPSGDSGLYLEGDFYLRTQ